MRIDLLQVGVAGVLAALVTLPAHATLVAVAGPASSSGVGPAIIAAPSHALDDVVSNLGMEGFDEAQGVLTTVAHGIDGGGVIPTGTQVNSHLIFLNSAGSLALSHSGVVWTFANPIIGVMSDSGGVLEAASTFELGNPGTNYTVPFGGSGPAAPFPARGLEGNNGTGLGSDGYTLLSPTSLRVAMVVTEPGDWIRVVTRVGAVPEPGVLWLLALGLGGLGLGARRKR